jgi:hypothetical protein
MIEFCFIRKNHHSKPPFGAVFSFFITLSLVGYTLSTSRNFSHQFPDSKRARCIWKVSLNSEDGCLLVCWTMSSGRWLSTFQRCLPPPLSGRWGSKRLCNVGKLLPENNAAAQKTAIFILAVVRISYLTSLNTVIFYISMVALADPVTGPLAGFSCTCCIYVWYQWLCVCVTTQKLRGW